MATSRTGTTEYLAWRRKVLSRDRKAGVTHCPICTVQLDYKVTRQPHSAEPDHIIPQALGGRNTVSNGRTICRLCNQRRGKGRDRPPAKAPEVSTLAKW